MRMSTLPQIGQRAILQRPVNLCDRVDQARTEVAMLAHGRDREERSQQLACDNELCFER